MTNKSPTDCRRSLHALLDVTLDADWNPTLSLDFHDWFHNSPSGRVWSVKCSNGPVNAVGRRWVHGHTSLWHFMLMRFLTRSSHDQQVAIFQRNFSLFLGLSFTKEKATSATPAQTKDGIFLSHCLLIVCVQSSGVIWFIPVLQTSIVGRRIILSLKRCREFICFSQQQLHHGTFLQRPGHVGRAAVTI